MEHHEGDASQRKFPAALGSRARLAFAGFAAIAGYLLWTEHRAHVIQFLPWALLALCPALHLFMHRGHRAGNLDRSGPPAV